jgi:hypothetical protein
MKEEPAAKYAPLLADSTGPFRVWGPTDDCDTGRHDLICEEVPTIGGPFCGCGRMR